MATAKQLPNFSYGSTQSMQKRKIAKKRSHGEVDDDTETKSPPEKKKKNKGISEYELQIQKNIEERKKLFEMLNFGGAKQELLDVLPNQRKRKLDEDDHDEYKENFI